MLEVLQYATSGFWVFIGCFSIFCIGACIISEFLRAVVNLFKSRRT